MRLRMWTYDLAREQCPSHEHLRRFCEVSLASGYNALGLYLELRFAYPSIPWSCGTGAVTPASISRLQEEFHELQIIPFINLLGHMEGLIYTEEGAALAEAPFQGMQACPSNPEFVQLCKGIVDDTLSIFRSEIIHLGGDETWQLGQCPTCAARIAEYEKVPGTDGKGRLYGEHFRDLAAKVVAAGRRPAVWADMFFDHPSALEMLPKETLIFDWQYFHGPENSSALFRNLGFETVFCPALHTYNATWLHLPQSEENVRQNVAAAKALDAYGVCVTTWECALMGNYETLLPAIRGCGRIIADEPPNEASKSQDYEKQPFPSSPADIEAYQPLREAPRLLRAYLEESEWYEEWARLMGSELQEAGGLFEFCGIRSAIKCRLLLYSNPFLLWLRNREDICGEPGTKALDVIGRALSVAPDAAARGVAEFAQAAIQFVRYTEDAHQAYARGEIGKALGFLSPCRQLFDNLAKTAKATHVRIGGSLADIERCNAGRDHIDKVIRRVKTYGDRSLGYLPSFETLTHPKFIPHDQSNWWLINRWANE
jgi:hypothetical protein